MTIFKRIAAAAAIALCALAPTAALAEKVLFLSTGPEVNDSGTGPHQTAIDNIHTYLSGKYGDGYSDWRNKLSTGTIDTASDKFKEAEIFVLAVGAVGINQDELDKLKAKMKDENVSFIIFAEGCDDNTAKVKGSTACQKNINDVTKFVGDATTLKLKDGGTTGGVTTKPRNLSSSYSSYFSALSGIKIERYRTISGAKADNQLYGADGDSAFAIFVPTTQTGAACVFLAGDLTMWKDGSGSDGFKAQRTTLGNTLLANVKPGSAACTAAPPPASVL